MKLLKEKIEDNVKLDIFKEFIDVYEIDNLNWILMKNQNWIKIIISILLLLLYFYDFNYLISHLNLNIIILLQFQSFNLLFRFVG